MNIIFLEWNSFGNEDMIENLTQMGHLVERIPFEDDTAGEREILRLLEEKMQYNSFDFVFSFNYYPAVSNSCEQLHLRYVSWVYDSPHIQAYSYTVLNKCNSIFLFDYAMYEELHRAGIRTVYYLPLAVNERRMNRLDKVVPPNKNYRCDVSFVGSLYSEKKHRLYRKFDGLPEYYKGYLDGLIQVQKQIHGYNFLEEMLTPDVVTQMQKVYPTNPNADTVLSPEALYADYVLARQVTALEREEVLQLLGKTWTVDLYTYDPSVSIPGVRNQGMVDYYHKMPEIFRESKINLNISLRSIKTGIPLRALDILGNGGFLLTNYQEEMLRYFVPDRDFVFYTDMQDLERKVYYYLEHDEERERIAACGRDKARSCCNYVERITEILRILESTR